jgi:hypothetical protein
MTHDQIREAEEDGEPLMVSRARVLAELARHSADVAEFDAEMGVHDFYRASAVLAWLGY